MPRGRPRKLVEKGPAVSMEERQEFRRLERKHLKEDMQVGARLRQIRRESHLTQEQVAAMLALNRTAYTHYENGLNMPDLITLVQLAAIYGVSPGEFMQYLTMPAGSAGESTQAG